MHKRVSINDYSKSVRIIVAGVVCIRRSRGTSTIIFITEINFNVVCLGLTLEWHLQKTENLAKWFFFKGINYIEY